MNYIYYRKTKFLFLLLTVLILIGNCANAMKQEALQQVGTVSQEDGVALFQAASTDDVISIKKLLAKGVDPNIINQDGNTSLMFAAAEGYTAAVETLLSATGIDPNKQNEDGNTALCLASYGY